MLSIVAIAAAVVLLGWDCRRRGIVGPEADKPFNDYLYYVSMPALILDKLTGAGLGAVDLRLLEVNALAVLLLVGLLLALWKAGRLGPHAGELVLCAAFGNTVYLGFPLTALRFGEDALAVASLVTAVQYLAVFTAGFAALALVVGRGGKQSLEVLKGNTILWSALLGAVLAFAGLRPPAVLAGALRLIGSATAPLALFALGLFLHGKPIGRRPGPVLALCAAKLLAFPALLVLCARATGLAGLSGEVSLLESLMPLAVTNLVLAQKLGLDESLVAEAILASTLASVPLLLAFDRLRGLLP
ncbi:MAG: AEC family transporter [Elusimicrobiota bacterium]|jgi:hypothetical protein